MVTKSEMQNREMMAILCLQAGEGGEQGGKTGEGRWNGPRTDSGSEIEDLSLIKKA